MTEILKGVFGQNKPISILKQIHKSGRIPHAFLFSGMDGTGKFFTAIEFAKLINYYEDEKRTFNLISKISKLDEPYIKYIFPLPRGKGENNEDSATEKLSRELIEEIQAEVSKKSLNPYYNFTIPNANNIKINSIRDIKKFISFNYDDIRYRIILISQAHLMNPEAQNALLKSLEEPPEGVIFILLTSSKESLLPTIESRCWQINFEPLSNENVEQILIEHFQIDIKIARKASIFADGSVTNALNLIDENFDELLKKTIEILRFTFSKNYYSAFNEFKSISNPMTVEKLKLIILMINRWFTDLQKYRSGYHNYFFEDYVETFEKFDKKYPEIDISQIISKNDSLLNSCKQNVSLNIILLNIIFEIASIGIR